MAFLDERPDSGTFLGEQIELTILRLAFFCEPDNFLTKLCDALIVDGRTVGEGAGAGGEDAILGGEEIGIRLTQPIGVTNLDQAIALGY